MLLEGRLGDELLQLGVLDEKLSVQLLVRVVHNRHRPLLVQPAGDTAAADILGVRTGREHFIVERSDSRLMLRLETRPFCALGWAERRWHRTNAPTKLSGSVVWKRQLLLHAFELDLDLARNVLRFVTQLHERAVAENGLADGECLVLREFAVGFQLLLKSLVVLYGT